MALEPGWWLLHTLPPHPPAQKPPCLIQVLQVLNAAVRPLHRRQLSEALAVISAARRRG